MLLSALQSKPELFVDGIKKGEAARGVRSLGVLSRLRGPRAPAGARDDAFRSPAYGEIVSLGNDIETVGIHPFGTTNDPILILIQVPSQPDQQLQRNVFDFNPATRLGLNSPDLVSGRARLNSRRVKFRGDIRQILGC